MYEGLARGGLKITQKDFIYGRLHTVGTYMKRKWNLYNNCNKSKKKICEGNLWTWEMCNHKAGELHLFSVGHALN